jgi:hypothetical protein
MINPKKGLSSGSSGAGCKSTKRNTRRLFPQGKIAKMWAQHKTISVIAHAIGRVDKDNGKDPYHSLRNCLHRMHKGYRNEQGVIVKLPHRVSKPTLRAARQAGLRAW